MKTTEMIVVSVSLFKGTTDPDKNGKYPVWLECQGGRMPNRNVLSGTVAENMGIEVGKTYLMKVKEQGYDTKFGIDFTYSKLRELETAKDIIEAIKELGDPNVFIVPKPDGFDQEYQRKGNAVESVRTQRIKEGLYTPSLPTSVTNHETAKNIVQGGENLIDHLAAEKKDALNK